MPSAHEFRPHPLLKNGHLMTVAAAFWRRSFALPEAQDRHFQVDLESKILGHCQWQGGKEKSTPLLVLVHGLEGSSDSNYMRGIAEKAFRRGIDVFTQIFFAGYSMGGNLVSKMAGELSGNAPLALRGVATVCPALNLAAC